MDIYVKFLLFPYCIFFLIFKHDFIRWANFTRIAVPNTASDQATN